MFRRRIGWLAIQATSKLSGVSVTKKESYIDAEEAIEGAKSQQIPVNEYVERLWSRAGFADASKGHADAVIRELSDIGALSTSADICEIGPGSGRYLERILAKVHPVRYHIYETDIRWAKYLEREYAPTVLNHPANGVDLRFTAESSCGAVCAFGVFVYLTVLDSFNYFAEMIRVCKPDGYIFFDFLPAESWDLSILQKWIDCKQTYPVVLPEKLVDAFFVGRGCKRIHTFTAPFSCDISKYAVFNKTH